MRSIVGSVICLAFAAFVIPADAAVPTGGRNMSEGEYTAAPRAFGLFCREHASDCAPNDDAVHKVSLTPELWHELEEVNWRTNRVIRYVTDARKFGRGDYWTYPVDRLGDCEDFALEKRRKLLSMGWPATALRIAVGRSPQWGYHAVLVVVTDRGDFVLDNNDDDVRSYHETEMDWIMRQTGDTPRDWVRITG